MPIERKQHTPEFKEQVAREFLSGSSARELGRKHSIHPVSVYQWVKRYNKVSQSAKSSVNQREDDLAKKLAKAERLIGQLLLLVDSSKAKELT